MLPIATKFKRVLFFIFLPYILKEYTADIQIQISVLSEIYTAVTRVRTNLFAVCNEETERIFRTVIGDTLYKEFAKFLPEEVRSFGCTLSYLNL